LDSDASDQTDNLSSDQIDYLLQELHNTELMMAMITLANSRFDASEGHCQRSLDYSRRITIEGEQKISVVFNALQTYTKLRQCKGDFPGALSFAEDGYNLVVDAYDPVHPQVQDAASSLIACLVQQGDLFNAERFAEQTYANLRDIKHGINQEREEVAYGAYNLANVIRRQHNGDLIKAENLARECLRIRTRLYGPDHDRIGMICLILTKILQKQGKFGDETKELLERSLATSIFNEGPDGMNTSISKMAIGQFHFSLAMIQSMISIKRTHLLLAKSYYDEAVRIETKIHIPTHPNRVAATSLLSEVMSELSRI
jgi:hypothetical protein